jgi:hypothetical protein
VLLVEQEVEGSAATPLDIVLAADAERTALLARRDELEALLETEVRATARAWRRTSVPPHGRGVAQAPGRARHGAWGQPARPPAAQPASQPLSHPRTRRVRLVRGEGRGLST